MDAIFTAFDLSGPAGDLKVLVFALLALGLIMSGAFLIARVFGISLGGQDDD